MIFRMVNGSFKGDPSEVLPLRQERPVHVVNVCAVWTVQPASCAALSDHNDATGAASVSNTPLRHLLVGVTFRDRRQPGHESAAPGGAPAATSSELAASAPR